MSGYQTESRYGSIRKAESECIKSLHVLGECWMMLDFCRKRCRGTTNIVLGVNDGAYEKVGFFKVYHVGKVFLRDIFLLSPVT